MIKRSFLLAILGFSGFQPPYEPQPLNPMVPFQLDELFVSMIARKGPDQWQVLEEVDGLGWSHIFVREVLENMIFERWFCQETSQ
jgi:hypothetical protein